MKLLVYGAGALGSLFAARLHDAGHDVSLLARGARLAELRAHGLRLVEEDRHDVRSAPVRVVDRPEDGYELIIVLVRAHQVRAALESLTHVDGDVLVLANWAAGPEPLSAVIGRDRLLLGFPTAGGRLVDGVLRHRADSWITRLVTVPISEPDGRVTPRLERTLRLFREIGMDAKAEPQVDAWLTTHAAVEVPLGQAVDAAGGPAALAGDRAAVRELVHTMRRNLAATAVPVIPSVIGVLHRLPTAVVAAVVRRFLLSRIAERGLTPSPAATAEMAALAEQLRGRAR
ncbi:MULTISPECIES: ketopantoate reductase family protein [Actinosynnema]|uniref:ketopantoate reductase family protein n=1 Tax=Actinosynnema TaxID=40566 RepID=UPI0020A4F31D|nr:2-dehydropantoate 2-reductase N-terminal domain-containing protein [Actinosynnema pretiosum]MCP2096421.1 2-dehydropantoate 2-reductase [Actinosynnema pretiosum]